MEGWQIYAWLALVILGTMTCLWLLSLRLRNASIVDVFWGIGFLLFNWGVFLLTPSGYLPRKILLSTLVTVWGLRLAVHLLWRNWGKPEDFRYAAWREQSGAHWWWQSYFKVFLLQGVILLFVAAPLFGAQIHSSSARLNTFDWLALPLWLIGFLFEAGGDWQMMRFKSNPANQGKILQHGFWRYTRHPNYFGDALQWWAFTFFALGNGAWWTILSPVLMTTLLIRVSGVAMLEKTLRKEKVGYDEYMQRTSAFFPACPKKDSRGE
jgi:steroid 5-alpha reductase family enzyme